MEHKWRDYTTSGYTYISAAQIYFLLGETSSQHFMLVQIYIYNDNGVAITRNFFFKYAKMSFLVLTKKIQAQKRYN